MQMSMWNRRDLLKKLGAGFAATAASCARTAVDRTRLDPSTRPNIVLILADDMGYSDLGCYGSEVATPNLDSLARRGVLFTQFYNTARCCPTRASLLTGLYAHQTGVGHMTEDHGRPGYRGDLNRECLTIAEVLRATGYHTLMTGKWHLTAAEPPSRQNWPLQRGFEKFYGTIAGAGSYYDPVTLTRDNSPIQPAGDTYYYTDAISDNAAGFVEAYGGKEEPFFLYVAYTSPHWPLHALPEDIRNYQDTYRRGWDGVRAGRHRRMIDLGIVDGRWPITPRDPGAPAWKDAPNKEWEARRMAVYAAQIDRMDQGIGRILAKLREVQAEENTLVFFLSDNGACKEESGRRLMWQSLFVPHETRDGRAMRAGNDPSVMPGPDDTYQSYGLPWANASNTPFRLYKHWVHEGGIATPLIACWPAMIRQHNRIIHQPGHVIDIMATIVEAAGAEYPATHQDRRITPIEGKSLVPVVQGGEQEPREAIYWEHEGNRAVRQGKWKLVSRHPGAWELYDLEADRTELSNLADKNADKVAELIAMYENWATRCGVLPWSEVIRKA